MGKGILRRSAIAATVCAVAASSGTALAWNGNGNNNGWDNKNVRGCPDDYALAPTGSVQFPDLAALTDLNGDGMICVKLTPPNGSNGENYIDNISNH